MVPLAIKVKARDLLDQLDQNRTKHELDYTVAVKNYWEAYERQLREALAQVGLLKGDNVYKPLENKVGRLPFPTSYVKDYDVAIGMIRQALEFDPEAIIELDTEQYKQLWMDDWGWKQQFLSTNSSYTS